MYIDIGNYAQKHLMFSFLLFPPCATNKNNCTTCHNARGKLNIELIMDRKLSKGSVLQATCDPKPPLKRCTVWEDHI